MADRLFLPPVIYGTTGIEMNLYFANVFTTVNPANYAFNFHAPLGRCDRERWRCIPRQEDVGIHEAHLEVFDDSGLAASGECRIVITPSETAANKKLRLLMIGDSLTDQGHFPVHFHTLCRRYGMDLTMLGTNVPEEFSKLPGQLIKYPDAGLLPGVRHEGWGGWSAATFLTRKEDSGSKYHWGRRSPFLDADGVFDFRNYLEKYCGGIAPDIIMISLGSNDMLSIDTGNQEQVIGNFVNNMELLYRNLHAAAPDAVYCIGIEPWGSNDQSAWGKNYGSHYFSWNRRSLTPGGYRQLMNHFQQFPNIYSVPLYSAIDPFYGYPTGEEKCFEESDTDVVRGINALHPNPAGYRQLANCTFAALLSILQGV